jgi:hypothetical protein
LKRFKGYYTPDYIDRLLVRNSEIHKRETRYYSKLNLMCPKYKRKTEGGWSFAARTIKEWNTIDANIRNRACVASFKYNLFKAFLVEQKATMRLNI